MPKFLAFVIVFAIPMAILAAPPETKSPTVSILLRDRHAQTTPTREGTAHCGGGNIDVQQPAPDTIVITLTGAVSAADHPCGSSASMNLEFEQAIDVVFEQPNVKDAKLTIEARAIGMVRSGKKGSASVTGASLTATGNGQSLALSLPDRNVAGGENLSVNDKAGPMEMPVAAGPVSLHACWQLFAAHPKALLGKSASAEFAPDPALDPLWIGGPRDPFHGAGKKDLGFQITVRVSGDAPAAPKLDKVTRLTGGK